MDKDIILVIILVCICLIFAGLNDIKAEREDRYRRLEKKQFYSYDWNYWFERETKKICHDRYCLSYLEDDTSLQKKFWENIQKLDINVEKDKRFQRLLIDYNDKWYVFKKLVYSYALRFDFLPELVEIMNKDQRFSFAKEVYEKGKADRKF
ncbi:MAG: hypothetical protein J6X42_03790 [Alphaproteobacteria bacterium]|nr:hypothetical protein [Alphaproteobacteria bacterium]